MKTVLMNNHTICTHICVFILSRSIK